MGNQPSHALRVNPRRVDAALSLPPIETTRPHGEFAFSHAIYQELQLARQSREFFLELLPLLVR